MPVSVSPDIQAREVSTALKEKPTTLAAAGGITKGRGRSVKLVLCTSKPPRFEEPSHDCGDSVAGLQ